MPALFDGAASQRFWYRSRDLQCVLTWVAKFKETYEIYMCNGPRRRASRTQHAQKFLGTLYTLPRRGGCRCREVQKESSD